MSLGIAIAIHPQIGAGGAPVQSLPSGAIGGWYSDTYTATPRKYVPNSVSATAATASLISAPRRLFTSVFWTGTGATITDNAATGPDGLNQASTVVLAANGRMLLINGITLPAGTYTLALNVKRNTGTDQPFRTSFNFSDNKAHTATSAWTRVTHTATVGAGLIDLLACWTPDASTTASLQVCDVQLFAGSSDLGAEVLAGHMYLGKTNYDSAPTASGGWLDMSTGGGGLIQFFQDQSLTAWTVMTVISKVAAGSSYQGILSKIQSNSNFTAYSDQDLKPLLQLNGSDRYQQAAGLYPLLSDGPHIITHRYDGTTAEMWVDDVRLYLEAAGGITTILADVLAGLVGSFTNSTGCKFNSIVLANVAWDSTALTQARSYLTARAATSAISITTLDRVGYFVGDSITATQSPLSYAYLYGANDSPRLFGAVNAAGGGSIANLIAQAAIVDATLPTNRTGRKFILSVFIGANDIVALTAGTFLTSLASYCDARRAAGWLVTVATLLPNNVVGFNALRNTANTTIRTWTGVHADAIVDFAANATMGPDGAELDTTYYSDGLHPTAAGQAILETVIRPVINAL